MAQIFGEAYSGQSWRQVCIPVATEQEYKIEEVEIEEVEIKEPGQCRASAKLDGTVAVVIQFAVRIRRATP